jgi:hypothetical protein
VKRAIEVMWWDKLRSPRTVQSMIQMVYNNKKAADDQLVQRIVEATLHPRYAFFSKHPCRPVTRPPVDRRARSGVLSDCVFGAITGSVAAGHVGCVMWWQSY